MNISLLAKWWFRFKDPTISGKWKAILTDKYSLSGLDSHHFSAFWAGILYYRDIFDLGINQCVGNGNNTSFWLDRWFGDCFLYCSFPQLFRVVSDPNITVAAAFSNSRLMITFCRQLTGVLRVEWFQLLSLVTCDRVFTDTSRSDLVTWRWGPNG